MATSSADGMRRPNGYQAFAFVNGTFAGTVSPKRSSEQLARVIGYELLESIVRFSL